ncbi:hypothetical protein G7Y89_g11565 [Cudoniella acicularis]|uniref:CorA-like transporter domain-containing protein n=1 Tax=Cudoniella acicularis TaxID=354080 RepID=A0A8H4W008_9HELO|nr:hypothetical protein G7Y89_g11565 [Cudoniella acicularis]
MPQQIIQTRRYDIDEKKLKALLEDLFPSNDCLIKLTEIVEHHDSDDIGIQSLDNRYKHSTITRSTLQKPSGNTTFVSPKSEKPPEKMAKVGEAKSVLDQLHSFVACMRQCCKADSRVEHGIRLAANRGAWAHPCAAEGFTSIDQKLRFTNKEIELSRIGVVVTMTSKFNLDDVDGFRAKIDRKAANLFRKRAGEAPLYVNQIPLDNENENDFSQIFVIRQRSSWSTLDTSREMVEGLITSYKIFAPFWKCVLTYGTKTVENEFEFPGFRCRKTPLHECGMADVYESAYMLRRVEYNRRKPATDRNAWSVRQTAVYHQLSSSENSSILRERKAEKSFCTQNKSIFLLISPSKNANEHIHKCYEFSCVSPWIVQRLLVADSKLYQLLISAKANYIAQSQRIVCADPGLKTENLTPLTNIYITFADQQELKTLQDDIHDLQLIMPTMLKTLKRVRAQFRMSCDRNTMSLAEKINFDSTTEEFDEYINEAEIFVERVKDLEGRAKSTTKLISDLLSYEEAVALKELAKKSHNEGQSMHK